MKGILLFGPPGCGKTLMARQIGKMLNAREPKIVNGPEILNKYVGESEANIRKLFAEAEEEQKRVRDATLRLPCYLRGRVIMILGFRLSLQCLEKYGFLKRFSILTALEVSSGGGVGRGGGTVSQLN